MPSDVVIVGASAAGLATAEALRNKGYDGALTLVGDELHLPYDWPPLSKQILSGAWEPERGRLRDEESIGKLCANLRLGRTAVGLDLAERRVRLDGGDPVGFDALVIATGVTPRRLPGDDLAGVHVLRTLDDALVLRAHLLGGPKVVVVGAGFLGAEVAAVARTMGLEVTLVDPLPVPMQRQVGESIGELVRQMHSDHGVALRLGTGVARFEESAGRVVAVELADGTKLDADAVVVAVGSTPATDWLTGSDLAARQRWWCVNTMSQHCERKANRFLPRFDLPNRKKASALCGCGSFAEAMVVDEATVVAVRTDLPDEQLALLGCGVTTGLGAALNTAAVQPGSSVAVIGCGGVGQSVIQGARIAGASTIIAVDLSPGRREASLRVGATHAVDPAEGDPVGQVRALTGGRGADHSFEAVGLPQLLVQAFDMARLEGTVTFIGMPPARDAMLTLPAVSAIFTGKRIQGSVVGGSQILRDFPRYIRLAETGQLDLDAMVSRRITLDEVNEGIESLERGGEGVRTVIV